MRKRLPRALGPIFFATLWNARHAAPPQRRRNRYCEFFESQGAKEELHVGLLREFKYFREGSRRMSRKFMQIQSARASKHAQVIKLFYGVVIIISGMKKQRARWIRKIRIDTYIMEALKNIEVKIYMSGARSDLWIRTFLIFLICKVISTLIQLYNHSYIYI